MSARARDWAYSVHLPICQKFVLVALAERANDDGLAWPSVRTICDMTGACDKAVRNALKQLEQGGFIARVSSGTRSKTYRLSIESQNEIPVSGTDQPVPHTTQPVSGTGQTGTTYRQTVKNRKEPLSAKHAPDADWVSANWMRLGNEVLDAAGVDPAKSMVRTGEVRQWLADARDRGYGYDAAREVILSAIREKCERGAGQGKPPAWFRIPVQEALASGAIAASEATAAAAEPEWTRQMGKDYTLYARNAIGRQERPISMREFQTAWMAQHNIPQGEAA